MDVKFSIKKKVLVRFLSFFQELLKKMLTKIFINVKLAD